MLFLPLLVLARWAADRYLRGSPGRRLARIAITDATGTARGAALASGLARRYARLAWPFLPAVLLGLLTLAVVAVGSIPPVLSTLNWAAISVTPWAAVLAAASSIIRHGDAFYDAPVGTVVAPRTEIGRNEPPPRRAPTSVGRRKATPRRPSRSPGGRFQGSAWGSSSSWR